MKKLVALVFSLAVLGAGMLGSTASLAKETLQLKGSDTMVHLATNWAEDYMKKNEGSDLAVTGGGSGTGIAALLNGTTDIACASRKIKQKEIHMFAGCRCQSGMQSNQPGSVCRYGLYIC